MSKLIFNLINNIGISEAAKSFRRIACLGIGALSIAMLAFAQSATAQCGGSLEAMLNAAIVAQSQPSSLLLTSPSDSVKTGVTKGDLRADDDDRPPIVGLWHINFNITVPGAPGPVTIQEAFQIFNLGGTEVHNPNVDPRTGSVCLGAWSADHRAYRLTHRVWSYSTDGNWLGTINLAEVVRVTGQGNNQTGTFVLDFFNPDGTPRPAFPGGPSHIEGVVVGERVTGN